jgi:hypothetical protein
MKKILLGVALTLTLLGLGLVGRETYRVYRLNQAVSIYLLSETEIRDKNGKPLSRAELIDLVLADVVKRNSQPSGK